MAPTDDLRAEVLGDERTGTPSDDATAGATPDTLLTRRQAARELGKHVSTVRRLERKAVLQPVRGDDGVHRFPKSHVRAVRDGAANRDATTRAVGAFDDGATSAAVFELFATGVAPVDVVIRL